MRASFRLVLLVSLTSCAQGPESVRGTAQENVTGHDAELRASCATMLDQIDLSHDLGAADSADVTVESRARGIEDCFDYSWVRAVSGDSALVAPAWAGPSFSASAWDCSHSNLEYGVYRGSAQGFQYVGGGMAFGAISPQGDCSYSVANFPQQDGQDVTLVLAGADGAAEVRIGVRAWSHNDAAMGHSGRDCEGTSCYWPVRLWWRGQ